MQPSGAMASLPRAEGVGLVFFGNKNTVTDCEIAASLFDLAVENCEIEEVSYVSQNNFML